MTAKNTDALSSDRMRIHRSEFLSIRLSCDPDEALAMRSSATRVGRHLGACRRHPKSDLIRKRNRLSTLGHIDMAVRSGGGTVIQDHRGHRGSR